MVTAYDYDIGVYLLSLTLYVVSRLYSVYGTICAEPGISFMLTEVEIGTKE